MKIPSVDLRAFNFKKAAPLITKREVNRVHIPDWDDGEFVHDEERRESGPFLAEILFILVF
jgi:hypothetical protein